MRNNPYIKATSHISNYKILPNSALFKFYSYFLNDKFQNLTIKNPLFYLAR